MIRRDADVLVLGSGIAAWCAALELAQRARTPAVLPIRRPPGTAPGTAPGARTAAVGFGLGTYPDAVDRWGPDEARAIWELGREEATSVREACRRLGAEGRWRGEGGFLLAATRAESSALADAEDALRDDGFGGEFLDHFMIEARFDVRGIAGAYWAADEGEYDAAFVFQGLRRRALDAGAREGPSASGVIDVGPPDVTVGAGGAEWHAPVAILAPDPEEAARLEGVAVLGAERAVATLSRARLTGGSALPCPARRMDGAAGWAGGGGPIDAWRGAADGPALTAWLADIGLGSAHPWSTAEVAFPADGRPVIGRSSSLTIMAWSGGAPGSDWPMVAARRAVEMAMGGDPAVPAPLRPRPPR